MEHYKDWKNHKIQYVKYKGKIWSNIGITMSSAEDVKIGDIIRCIVRLIRKINDTEYHWLIARVLEPRPEKTVPDPVETADRIAKVSQYKVKSCLEKCTIKFGEEEYYDLEALYEQLVEERLPIEALDLVDENIKEMLMEGYMTVPDENKVWQFAVQAHIRGCSVHL